MRNGFNQFSIPYMNELTANQLGVASTFGGNTPLGFINQSLGTISNWFQGPCPYAGGCGPPGRITPGEFERIIRGLPGQTPTPGTPRTPPTFPTQGPPVVGPGSPGVPSLPPEGTPEGDRIRDAMGLPRKGGGGGLAGNCSVFDLECWFARLIGSDVLRDAGKRIGLVLLGAALLIVAIVSLR